MVYCMYFISLNYNLFHANVCVFMLLRFFFLYLENYNAAAGDKHLQKCM